MTRPYDHESPCINPATSEEMVVIDQAINYAVDGVKTALQTLRGIRMSDEVLASLEMLEGLEILLKHRQAW